MINSGAFKLAAAVLLAVCGCGGGGSDGPVTQATPLDYPAGFPVSEIAPAGATWYSVAGLTAGQAYLAGIAVQQPGPNIELDVYKAFEPTPPTSSASPPPTPSRSPASSPRRAAASTS
jgi:hypothetical protein